MLESGDKIIKVIEGGGFRTGSFAEIESDDGNVVKLKGQESLSYNSLTHNEIDPAIPGFRSYLVMFDGDEEDKVNF